MAKWITTNNTSSNAALYTFKKSFTVTRAVSSFSVRISADTRYRLYINGIEICQGPCSGGAFKKYFEEVECGDALKVGDNIIEVKVLHDASEKHLITMFRRQKPALFFEGIGQSADGLFEIVSDESFEVYLHKHIAFENRREIMWSVGPFENVSASNESEKLETEVLFVPHTDLNNHSPWGVADRYRLEKRPLPLISEGEKTELNKIREYTDESGKYNIIFESPKYTTAMLTYEYSAAKDCTFKAIYTECALSKDSDGKLYKGIRDNKDGFIDSTAFDVFRSNGTEQAYEPFTYRAFRYIRVECDKKLEYLRVLAARYTYDYEKNAQNAGVGYFESSDPLHSKVWEICRNTLECCTHETVVDCPFWEQQQYMMDGGLESLFAWRLSNDSAIQRKLLLDMAQSQNFDGLISANYPNIDRQIIPGFSLYFVLAVREYLRYTGDIGFARQMTSFCDRILEYFDRTLTREGLVRPEYGWCYLDWVASWQNGIPTGADKAPVTAYSLMYAAALNAAAEVCGFTGRSGLFEDYKRRAEQAINAVKSHCYDSEKGLYTDVCGIKSYSQHTAVWAILAGAVTGDGARSLMERTMNSTDVAKCSFSMRYYLLRALEVSDCYEKYADSVLAGWKTMLDNNTTTWWEDSVTCRSECHGWSCAPMYEMSAVILGVKPIGNGFGKVLIKPHILGLSYAMGRIPILDGWIDAEWHHTDGKFELTVKASRSLEMEIISPSGKTVFVFADSYTLSDNI